MPLHLITTASKLHFYTTRWINYLYLKNASRSPSQHLSHRKQNIYCRSRKMYYGICKQLFFLCLNSIPKIARHFILSCSTEFTHLQSVTSLSLRLQWTYIKRSPVGHQPWHELFRVLVMSYGLSAQAAEFSFGLETLDWFPHITHPH